MTTGNRTVDAVYALRSQSAQFGKIFNSWALHLRRNGRPDTDAIFLLSQLLQMHEPQILMGEDGKPRQITTFLEGEYLQITSKALQQLLGVGKATVSRRLRALEEHGVIRRHVERRQGAEREVKSTLQIELRMEKIRAITYEASVSPATGETQKPSPKPGAETHPNDRSAEEGFSSCSRPRKSDQYTKIPK